MSYLTENGASYDRTLLSSVPDPTRAEKQEGYNVDLLEPSRERRPRTSPPATNDDQHGSSAVDYSPGAVSYARKDEAPSNGYEPVVTKVPWYRTRRGVIIIVAIAIAIICAVVGGVVGGTHHSSKSKSDSAGQQNTGSGNTTSQGQGQQSNAVGSPSSSIPLSASSGSADTGAGTNAAAPASSTATTSAPTVPVVTNPASSASASSSAV